MIFKSCFVVLTITTHISMIFKKIIDMCVVIVRTFLEAVLWLTKRLMHIALGQVLTFWKVCRFVI